MKSKKKSLRCPSCNGNMNKVSEEMIYFCESCKINTANLDAATSTVGGELRSNEISFKEEIKNKHVDDAVDLVLVAPRHLFRAPYSLHEKTAFASIVIEKEEIQEFKPSDADPLKIKKVKSFMPRVIPGEARELLHQALDWGVKNKTPTKKYEGKEIDLSGLTITEDMFPPIMQLILKGVKSDGRKRALSFLLSFYTSLDFPQDYIEEKIEEWNKKNYHPLKQGYIKSQVAWHGKNKRLPPNYDKPLYKLFGKKHPSEDGIKNPINYTIKKAMSIKARKENKKTTSHHKKENK